MINFLKYTKIYFLVSAICIFVGLYSIATKGYVLSIDFTGGTVVEYRTSGAFNEKKVLPLVKKEKISVVDSRTSKDSIYLKTQPIDEKKEVLLRNSLEKQLKIKLTTLRYETVGPLIGKEMIQKTIFASVIAIAGILLYMTFAFKSITFGIAAVVAMAHDFLILMGTYSLVSTYLGAELDTLFVTALLTTLSFSVHDTIVLFDKIREYRKNSHESFDAMANRAFSETVVRSLNNSLTIVLMLTALVLIGGETTRFFALALLIGTISGTYSSPFIAVPVLRNLVKVGLLRV
jgi:preprotein translocase subunit SecF